MTMEDSRQIKIITLDNPLDLSQRTESWAGWSAEKSLREYIPEIEDGEYLVSVSGGVVDASLWAETYLTADDTVVMIPVVYGGGGGGAKNILRLVAFVALSYFTLGTGGLGAGGLFASGGAIGGGLAAASAAYVAGAVLINALLPVPTAKAPENTLDDSPSYGINGPRNTTNEGVAVPVIYGTHKFAGNVIGLYTQSAGRDQYLFMLINAGEGPIAGISDIKLNDQSIDAFEGVEHHVGLGVLNQTPPPWFGDTLTPLALSGTPTLQRWDYLDNIENPAPNPSQFIELLTTDEVDALRFDFVAPLGLLRVDSKGKQHTHAVQLRVAYKRVTSDGSDIPGEVWNFTTSAGGIDDVEDAYDYFEPGPGDRTDPVRPRDENDITPGGGSTPLPDALAKPINTGSDPTTPGTVDPDPADDNGDVTPNDQDTWNQPISTTPGEYFPRSTLREKILRAGTTVQADGTIRDANGILVGSKAGDILRRYGEDPGNPAGPGTTLTGYSGSFYSFSGKSRVALRLNLITPELTQGYYKIRIGRGNTPQYDTDDKISDLVQLEAVQAIVKDDVAYRNTAWLALRVKISDQLSNVPNVTFTHQGTVIKTWDPVGKRWLWENSSNPAWVCLDMLTNTRYGGGIAMERIDIEAFKDWARYCDEVTPALAFNGPFDQQMPMWDALKYVCRAGHAQLIRNGSRFSVVIERADTPIMMFSEANIVQDSFQTNWLSLAERANAVQLTYFDRDRDWERTEVRVVSPLLQAGEEERVAPVTLYGVTDRDRAIQEGWLHLNLNNHVTRTISFEANIDAIACTVGSLIAVKHTGVNYEAAGRLTSQMLGSPMQMHLDQPITMGAGKSYRALIHIPAYGKDVPAESACSIVEVNQGDSYLLLSNVNSDNYVALDMDGNTYLPGRVTHLEVWRSGVKVKTFRVRRMDDTTVGGYVRALIVDSDVTGVVAGDKFRLVYGDLVFERAVSNSSPGVPIDVVSVSGAALPHSTPGIHTHWMIGEVTNEVRKYRVVNISGSGSQYTRTIEAIEYKDAIYDTTGFLSPDNPYGPAPTGPGDPVDYTRYIGPVRTPLKEAGIWYPTERWTYANKRFGYILSLKWRVPQIGAYKGVDIWRQFSTDNRSDWEYIGSFQDVTEANIFFDQIDKNDQVRFRIQSFDTQGRRSAFTVAPVVPSDKSFHTIGLIKGTTSAVTTTALELKPLMRQILLRWDVDLPDAYAGADIWYTFTNAIDPVTEEYEDPDPDFGNAILLKTVEGVREYIHVANPGKYRFWIRSFDGAEDREAAPYGGLIGSALRTLADLYSDNPADFQNDLETMIDQIIAEIPNLVRYEDYSALNDAVMTLTENYWDQFQEIDLLETQINAVGATAGNNAALIVAEQTARADEDAALASQISLVSAKADANEAAILLEQTARADADTAFANQLSVIVADVDANEAAIQAEQTARATAVAAEAASREALSAVLGVGVNKYFQDEPPIGTLYENDLWFDTNDNNRVYVWNGSAWVEPDPNDNLPLIAMTAIATERVARATEDGVLAQDISDIQGDLYDPTTGLSASFNIASAVQGQINNSETGLSATVTRVSALESSVNNPTTGLSATAQSVETLRQDILDPTTGALTVEIERLDADIATVSGELNKTYRQDEAPVHNPPASILRTGDIWIDSNDGDLMRRWDGSAWVSIVDKGVNRTFYQAAAPAGTADRPLVAGDIWVDSDDNNKMYRYNGTSWASVEDPRWENVATNWTNTFARVNDHEAQIYNVGGIYARLESLDNPVTGSVTELQEVVITGDLEGRLQSVEARWEVLVEVNGYTALVGLWNNGQSSGFQIRSDTFSLISPNGSGMMSANTDTVFITNLYADLLRAPQITSTALVPAYDFQRGTGGATASIYWNSGGFGAEANAMIIGGAANGGVIITPTNIGTYAAPPSDKRLKKNLQPIGNAVEKVMSIGAWSFEWNQLAKNAKIPTLAEREHGVLAQDVAKVVPDAVMYYGGGNEQDLLAVRYDRLVPLLIAAIQEQQAQIEELKSLVSRYTQR